MKKAIFLVALLTALAGDVAVRAQVSDNPQEQKGLVFRQKNSEINFNTAGWPAATAALLKVSVDRVRSVAALARPFQPPVGFDAVYNEFTLPVPKDLTWQKAPPVVIDFGLLQYYADGHTNAIKPGTEAMADIGFEINSFRNVFDDTYSHDIADGGYACPIFFLRYTRKQTDSTREYLEYQSVDGSKPYRIITNGKPIYVPFTREQYLGFQIQLNKITADKAMRTYTHDSLTIANIPAKKDILKGEIDLVNTWRERMNRHRQQLEELSPEQRMGPAYIVFGGGGGADDMEELTSADDSRGQELWTINPNYFNRSLPSTAIQLIVVKPEYAHIATAFIKAKVMEVYQAIDYKALKTLIQN